LPYPLKEKKKTIIFVTHDIEEAVFLADRIVIMTPSPGKVKSIIKVPLARKRDRTGSDFLKVRDRVFAEFELKPRDMTEYYCKCFKKCFLSVFLKGFFKKAPEAYCSGAF